MRLNLAQYRELAAFAQFGSDLDKATQQVLRRGERLTEILKQPQYQPMGVEDQVLIIYAGTSGGIDDLPVKKVAEFEKAYLAFVRDNHPEIAEALIKDKGVSDATKAALDRAIQTVKSTLAV
jgi:F-type H+-transporting ATPase subunit alpha